MKCSGCNIVTIVAELRTSVGFFFFFCLLGHGGVSPLHNFASIKAMTMGLGGEIIRPKMFPLR